MAVSQFAALCAERIGDDALAERYATFLVDTFANWATITRHTGRLVLARVCRRRGEDAAARAHFDQAADDALNSRYRVFALHVAYECGGEAGEAILERTVEAIGRPRDQLLTEYAEARGVDPALGLDAMAKSQLQPAFSAQL